MTDVKNHVVKRATVADVPYIEAMVKAAYTKYITRIGRLPAPMEEDYATAVETKDIYVLRASDQVVGCICLSNKGESIMINNLVVDPSAQGKGYGKLLMEFAEATARELGIAEITLYTNEKMYENLTLYPKAGFVETGRRTDGGFARVYFRKLIGGI